MHLLMRLVSVLLGLVLSAPAATRGDFRWQGSLAAGRTLEVKGVSGNIEATAAGGTEVEVVARKHGRRSDPALVEVKVVEHDGGVTICAVYPSPDGHPNECLPGERGHMTTRDNDVAVDFTVRVPAGVRFVARTTNGNVEASALGADAEAYTVNGNVRVATAGRARAETVNGNVTAVLGKADWTEPLALRTVNGDIRLTLPASAGAELRAETVNGKITTDFPLTGSLSRRRLSGTIGSGGRQLTLETVNGSIHIGRAQ